MTLVELLVVMNIVAILVGADSIVASEYGSESRCMEIFNVLPQIVRSQALYRMRHNQHYTADHGDLKNCGVKLSEVSHFTYSPFSNEFSTFSVKADATE